jgi:hypothetical protein
MRRPGPRVIVGLLLAVVVLLLALRDFRDESPAPPGSAPERTAAERLTEPDTPKPPEALPPSAQADPEFTGSLRIEVVDPSGNRIPEVWVRIDGGRRAAHGEGLFVLEAVPAGPGKVDAVARGLPPVRTPYTIATGEETGVRITLVPGGLPLAGQVVTEGNEPIENAEIRLSPRRGDWYILGDLGPARTGPDGRFRFEGLPDGRFTVRACAPCRMNDSQDGIDAGRLDLRFVLGGAGEIEGTIVVIGENPETPKEDVFLTYRRIDDEDEATYWGWEEDARTWRRTSLTPGRYRVRVRSASGKIGESVVPVRAGEVSKVTTRLVDEAEVLEGRVLSAKTGKPLPGAIVAAVESDAHSTLLWTLDSEENARINGIIAATTDADGRYVLRGLFPGAWIVATRMAGYLRESVEGVGVPGPGPIFRLETAGAIDMLVLCPDGRPVAKAWTCVEFDDYASEGAEGNTDASGRCTLACVPPGTHELTVQVGHTIWRARVAVTVRAGETTSATVRPPGGDCVLTGRLTRSDLSIPEREISVAFTDESGTDFKVCGNTGAGGRFRIGPLRPGPAKVHVGNLFGAPLREVVLTPGENVLDLELPSLSLRFLVVDRKTGEPLQAAIYARGRRISTGRDGRGRLTELTQGPTDITVYSDRHAPLVLRATPSRDPEETRVPMDRAIALTLLLVDPEGRPVGLASVNLANADGWDAACAAEQFGISRPETGRRVFSLAPGTYALTVTREGFRTHEARLDVPAPGNEITVVLQPE